jgi:hypothetical protein
MCWSLVYLSRRNCATLAYVVSAKLEQGSPLVGHCTLQDPPLEVYPNRSIHQCHLVSLQSGISRLLSYPRTDYGRGVTMEDRTELYV